MGRQETTKFILQIKPIWGFYSPSRVSDVALATTSSGIGLRSDGGVSVGAGIFYALDHTLSYFTFSLSLRCLHHHSFI